MLQECAIITIQDRKKIVSGLKKIQKEIANNKFNWNIENEDVHLNIESRLIELIGDVAKNFTLLGLGMIRWPPALDYI